MAGIVDIALAHAVDPSMDDRLREGIAACLSAVEATAFRGDRGQVVRCESAIRADPTSAFRFDAAGRATLVVDGKHWDAGRFESVSIADLRKRARGVGIGQRRPRIRVWVFDGASPLMDIGALQASGDDDTLFQAASQFNCLESPGPYVVPVADYFGDPTQGPRASISAFPATLLRHYKAPTGAGTTMIQETDSAQIDLLSDACGARVSRNAYLTGHGLRDPEAFARTLQEGFESIRVGVHDGVEVVLGYDFDGSVGGARHRIAQTFTSTVAGGLYGGERNLGPAFLPVCRLLLRAAYLGTLLTAASLGRQRVVLTLIGGGVFRNPVTLIWEAIGWALEEAESCIANDLDVIVNGFHLSTMMDLDGEILPMVRRRGGAVLRLDGRGLEAIRR